MSPYRFAKILTVGFLFSGIQLTSDAAFAGDARQSEPDVSMYAPLPEIADSATNPVTSAKALLGERLFSEERLSRTGKISCNWCHRQAQWGQDGKPTSKGVDHLPGVRNSPTVLNAALHFTQFWDGRTRDVETQALQPILNPVEMGMPSPEAVENRLRYDASYQFMFKLAFPKEAKPLTFENIGKAIAAYERILITPGRFDRYLKGDKNALSQREKKGLATFNRVGCNACHNGPLLGGNSFKKLGLAKPYPTQDQGRYYISSNPADKYVFKVPSLRNVSKTEPYLHDGSVRNLKDMIAIMGEYQLGVKLSRDDINDIEDFLKALEGDLRGGRY